MMGQLERRADDLIYTHVLCARVPDLHSCTVCACSYSFVPGEYMLLCEYVSRFKIPSPVNPCEDFARERPFPRWDACLR
jgi:hypothetical protein